MSIYKQKMTLDSMLSSYMRNFLFFLSEIAKIMETVSGLSSLTSTDALQYLTDANIILQHDMQILDPELGCSVSEATNILGAIADSFESSGNVDVTLIDVGSEMTKVVASILRSISKIFCDSNCAATCRMSIYEVRPLVRESEGSLLKILRVLIDGLNRQKIEIYSDMTISAYETVVKDIFDQRIFSILEIPSTPGNIAVNDTFANMTVTFMMISCTENLYSFIPDPGINGGIFKTFLVDEKGENVEIFDVINFFVNSLINPYDTSNVLPHANNSENLEASFDFGTESGMVSVVLNTLQECTVSVSSQNSSFDIITKGINTIVADGSPANIDVQFTNQTLAFYATPPNPPMNLFVYCEACMQAADIIFVLDASGSIGTINFEALKNFTISFVDQMTIGPTSVRIALMTFDTFPMVQFDLNQYITANEIIAATKTVTYTAGGTYTGIALQTVRTSMLPLARPNVQKMIVLLTDGMAVDGLLMYDEADTLKASGVEILCIGIGGSYMAQLATVSSDPDSSYYFQVTFNGLVNLATHMVGEVCAGLWTNLTNNQIRAGKLSMYAMNTAQNTWELSPDLKMKSMEGTTVVFESNFFGSFGFSIMAIPPETIDFSEVFTNFDDKIVDNPYVLVLNCVLFAALAIGTIIMRKLDLEDKRMWQYKPLADNIDSAAFSYYISVHTGFWSTFRLSAVPYIILKGWYGETLCRPLVDKAGFFRNLIRWRCSNFLLKTDIDLGPLTSIKIWHDNSGVNNNLFLDKILISTGKVGEIYVFFCNDWLSDSKGDGKTYRQLFCAQSEFQDGNTLFSSITRFRLFDEHLLLSLFGRPSFSRFSRVQRLYCVASMMSMSFLASAMFFRAGDNTHVHGITIGPVKITYKQLYVGLVTSFMTFPVGFLMGYIFRNRRYKQNIKDDAYFENVTKDRAILPWFSVFVGYGLAGGALASGTFFTTLYSIQWGTDVSTDWMMSILFGTTNGLVFFDPFKVIMFSLIVALVFKGFARKEIEIMAPFYVDDAPLPSGSANIPFYNKWPGDNKESDALAEMRRRLELDQKLSKHFRGILIELLFVALLGLVCSHCVVTEAYLQNSQLISELQPSTQITNTSDIWAWLYSTYLQNLNPRRNYNNATRTGEERKFMSDSVSYRMGPIRLRQIRTKGNCEIPTLMEGTVLRCSPKLSEETEQTNDFCPGWTKYAVRCEDSGFAYLTSEETQTFTRVGEYDTYEGGGYVKDLNPLKGDVYYDVYKLKRDNWLDSHSRFLSVEIMVLNVNTKLFSLITFDIEMPTFGGYYLHSYVLTSRLYPYIDSWDYLVLAAQLLFVLVTFVRTVFFLYEAWKLKSKSLTSVLFWGTVLSLLLSFTAVGCYIARIDRTIVIVEKIFNSAGNFVSFELVQLLDDIYKGCIGVVLFIAILTLLQSLSFNYYLYMMKTSISLAKSDIMSFAFLVAIMLAGFSSFMYMSMGSSSYQFRDFFNTFGTLFRMMLAMVTFRDAELTTNAESTIVYSIFVFLMTILMVNVFICILNDAFSTVKSSWNINKNVEPFDEQLNEHFWWKLGQTFNFCSSAADTASKYKADSSANVERDFKKLDEMISRLYKQTSGAIEDTFTH